MTAELEYFHCSGCGSDHHARLFAAAERKKDPADRICIGRQGHVSLCEHLGGTYKDIQKAQSKALGHRRRIECRHSSHDPPADHHWNNGELANIVLTKGDRYKSNSFQGSEEGKGVVNLSLNKRTHVVFMLTDDDRPTAQQLRDFLQKLHQTWPTPWFPLENPSLTPLRMIDPNKCHCFNYQGSDQTRWPLRPNPSDEATRESLWSRPSEDQNANELPRCNDRAHSETLAFDHFHTRFSVSFFPGRCERPGYEKCLTLDYWRHFNMEHAWDSQWIYTLDLQSYGGLDLGTHPRCVSKGCRAFMKYETYGPLFACLGEDADVEKSANRECGTTCQAR